MAVKHKDGLSPAMQQFFRAKEQHPDALLFFRMGDFYELFHDDAVIASGALDLALTSRGKAADGAEIPMAGVPHHAAAGYLARLLEKGFKVAICEQMADPATVKGIVPREVVRVISPGLALDPDALDARSDNALLVVRGKDAVFGLACLELTRANLRACTLDDGAALLAEAVRVDPREVLVVEDGELLLSLRKALPRARVEGATMPDDARAVLVSVVGESACADAATRVTRAAFEASAVALAYAKVAQPKSSLGIRTIEPYDPRGQLVLDDTAVRNLELVRTLSGERSGTLLELLDETSTPMGARLMRRRMLGPLAEVEPIRKRHDAVEAFLNDPERRRELRNILSKIGDLERGATRAELALASPRDLGAIRDGLGAAVQVADVLRRKDPDEAIESLVPRDLCTDVEGLLSTALLADLPLVASGGGLIRDAIDPRIDELRQLSTSSKDVLLSIEQRERERSGIASLKIKFTKVFGYYIEITRPNLHLVPPHFRRKQTVANGERFTTDELEELQGKILGADESLKALEAEMFEDVRRRVGAEAPRLRALAEVLAEIDVHAALADIAHRRGYVRPIIDDSLGIDLIEARHPIVETLAAAGSFVPNDVDVDADKQRLIVITGPNMAGKSTTMRQVAVATIMAQMGSFVAAKHARIGVVDRIFTRVGASDDLGRGQSTFMVEMRETATILREATRRSLVVLDEIGRGTSTYDGLAIAWAVAEYLHDRIGCRALFATHYHELCELEQTRDGVRNYNVAAREQGGEVVFLHRLVPGASNRSYGIAVARLAGAPEGVLARAHQLLEELEGRGVLPARAAATTPRAMERDAVKESESELVKRLRAIDPERMSPIEALLTLSKLKQLLD